MVRPGVLVVLAAVGWSRRSSSNDILVHHWTQWDCSTYSSNSSNMFTDHVGSRFCLFLLLLLLMLQLQETSTNRRGWQWQAPFALCSHWAVWWAFINTRLLSMGCVVWVWVCEPLLLPTLRMGVASPTCHWALRIGSVVAQKGPDAFTNRWCATIIATENATSASASGSSVRLVLVLYY